MSEAKIKCEICGEAVHLIDKHLQLAHGPESTAPCTPAQYRARFPNAPIMSQLAMQRLEERKRAKQADIETNDSPNPGATASGRAYFHELFGLDPTNPEALNAKGKPIPITVSQQKEWAEMVPPKEFYEPNIETLKAVVMGLELNIPVMVYGHAGIGKTSIFRFICHHTNRPLVRVQHTSELEEAHVVGEKSIKKDVDENGNVHAYTEFEFGPLAEAMMNGWVYLADEYDRALPEVLSVYQAVLEGQPLYIKQAPPGQRLIKPHPEFRFVATGNTNGMGDEHNIYRSAMTQDAATYERFGIVVRMDYPDREKEKRILMEQAKVTEKDAEALMQFAEKIRSQFPNEMPLTIGPRVLITAAKLGLARSSFVKGIELAYANRLPEVPRHAALELAKRILA